MLRFEILHSHIYVAICDFTFQYLCCDLRFYILVFMLRFEILHSRIYVAIWDFTSPYLCCDLRFYIPVFMLRFEILHSRIYVAIWDFTFPYLCCDLRFYIPVFMLRFEIFFLCKYLNKDSTERVAEPFFKFSVLKYTLFKGLFIKGRINFYICTPKHVSNSKILGATPKTMGALQNPGSTPKP